MHVLATDTTSRRGGVCLLRDREVACELNVSVGLTFSENLLEMIDFLLRLSGIQLAEIDALAVTTGPGSFTGLRVGIATMKALALRLQRPLIGVTTLEALAAGAPECGLIASFIDARRNQVFAALYEKATPSAMPVLLGQETVLDPARWIRSLPNAGVKFVGDGTQVYRDLIEGAGHRVLASDYFVARAAGFVALERHGGANNPPAGLVDAFYIRPPDAEVSRANSPPGLEH